MKENLHTFIIWDNGRYKEKEILQDIAQKFTIKKTFNIKWSRQHFAQNLSRFYGKKLPKTNKKLEECGSGNFLVIVVNDKKPHFMGEINFNIRNAKMLYRSMTNQKNLIHASDNPEETDENLLFLLGINSQEFIKKYDSKYDDKHTNINKDMIGSPGWKTEKEMIEFIKKIPDTEVRQIQDTHLIITNNVSKICRFLNAAKNLFFMKRNCYKIPINGENKLIYIRRQI